VANTANTCSLTGPTPVWDERTQKSYTIYRLSLHGAEALAELQRYRDLCAGEGGMPWGLVEKAAEIDICLEWQAAQHLPEGERKLKILDICRRLRAIHKAAGEMEGGEESDPNLVVDFDEASQVGLPAHCLLGVCCASVCPCMPGFEPINLRAVLAALISRDSVCRPAGGPGWRSCRRRSCCRVGWGRGQGSWRRAR
jgi:hypothetical protein